MFIMKRNVQKNRYSHTGDYTWRNDISQGIQWE